MAESGPGSDALPLPLAQLLHAHGQPATESAWQGFVSAYSPLLLQVARSTAAGHDGAMDAYAFLLEALRESQYRRLRVYVAHDQARFSTWLLVVARRLCIDFHRRRYGRPQGATDGDAAALERKTRRRLVDLAADEIDVDSLTDALGDSPESQVRSAQLRQALQKALEALPPADRLLLVRARLPTRTWRHAPRAATSWSQCARGTLAWMSPGMHAPLARGTRGYGDDACSDPYQRMSGSRLRSRFALAPGAR